MAPSVVIVSIAGFWCFYGLLTTIRSLLLNPAAMQQHLLWLRLLVCALSVGLTWLLYWPLARMAAWTLRSRIAAAAILAAVAAAGFGGINAWIYRDWPRCAASSSAGGIANSAVASTTLVNGQTTDDCVSGILDLFAAHYVEGYFLMAAWAALYLAFGFAAETGAWERRTGEARAAAQLAELRALRYQVNPHFLFNALNALSALVMARRVEEADRMISRMSTFFRTSLAGDPTHDVRLDDEMALQRLYLEIEAVRFPKRLRFAFDLPDALVDVCVPGLILQPLVENAVRHGVARTRGVVTIRISATRSGATLRLRVADDARAKTEVVTGTGVGLRNVEDRLFARYGGSARFEAAAGPDTGFIATLWLPVSRHGQ